MAAGMDTAKSPPPTDQLSAVFSLRLAGLAKEVDRPKLFEYLRERMDVPLASVVERLKVRRDRILDFTSRDDARAEQLRLGDLGAVTVINEGWQVGDWFVDSDVPERFEQQLESAEANDADLVVAQLRASAPLDAQAAKVCESLASRECLRMNAKELLLFCPPGSSKGAASWVKAIVSRLSLALPDTPSFEATVALCPEQGRTLDELYRSLHSIEDEQDAEAAEDNKQQPDFAERAIPWPIAGAAWPQVLALGLTNATADLPTAISDYIQAYWPADPDSLRHYQKVTPAESGARNILRNYSLAADSRQRNRGRLLQKVRNMRELPTLPVMAMQAYKLAQSPHSNAEQLARFVEREPALCSRILTLVNSPHFGLSSKVESIRHGIVLLGWEEIAHLALLLSTKAVFGGGLGEMGQRLWNHAAQAAEVARHLSERVPEVSASRMFTAGLLHDVGKVCLYLADPEAMSECARNAEHARVPTYEVERERLGIDHAEVSGMLLRHWGLPERLCNIIERHHGVWPNEKELPLESALLGLVDHVTHRLNDGDEVHADQMRVHFAHAKMLEPYFGEFSNVTTDLLAEDLEGQLRHAA